MTERKRPVKPRYLDGEALRDKRVAACMEQADLAQQCGTTQQQVSKWEQGAYGCRLPMVAKLAAALGCDPSDLMPQKAAA